MPEKLKPTINADNSCSYAWVDFYKSSGKWYSGGVVFMDNKDPGMPEMINLKLYGRIKRF